MTTTELDTRPIGAILAGGRSRRMGRDKAALPLPDGPTMIEAVATQLSAVTRRVVVIGGTHTPDGATLIDDRRPGDGPLAGIESLLASGLDTVYVVCPCDVPLVTPAVLRALADAPSATLAVLHLIGEPDPRPLPMRIRADALPVVRRQLDAGRRAVHRLIDLLDAAIVRAPAAWAEPLANINTIDDYERLRTDR